MEKKYQNLQQQPTNNFAKFSFPNNYDLKCSLFSTELWVVKQFLEGELSDLTHSRIFPNCFHLSAYCDPEVTRCCI